MKYYNLYLPVFKQGDDLAQHLESCAHPYEAFLALAEQYKSAAEICENVASSIKYISNIQVEASTHSIFLATNSKKINKLVDQNVLIED